MRSFLKPFSPTILFNSDLEVSNHNELKQWIEDLYAASPVAGEGNFYNTGFTTYYYNDFTSHLHTVELFNELSEKILKESKRYIDSTYAEYTKLGVRDLIEKELKIEKMWFNVNPPGGYQGRHHHSKYLLAGTYYIDVPTDSGEISFTDPNPYSYYANQDGPNLSLVMPNYTFRPNEKELLIWPGWMDHEIGCNKRETGNRITVSFCINWKEFDDQSI